jgi:hypothetical protein
MWNRPRSWRHWELEAALRSHRGEPSTKLVTELSERIRTQPLGHSRAWSRLAFAAGLSVFILGTFASFGGLGYAASGATHTYDAVKQVVVKHKLTVAVHSSASAQYPSSPKKVQAHHAVKKPTTPTTPRQPTAVKQSPPPSNTLPNTGLSLLGTFVASIALIGAGIGLRRRERRDGD